MNENRLDPELKAFLAPPIAATRLGRFREGAAAPWVGLRFLNARRPLWKYAAAPIAVNVAITAALVAFLILAFAWATSAVKPRFDAATVDWPAPVRFGAELAVAVVLLIAFVGIALILWRILTGVLCGLLYELLAKRVEEELGVAPGELRGLSFSYQVADTLYDLAALAAIHATFFLVGLLPLVGAPLAVAGDFGFTWFLFGADFLDFPLALRGGRRKEKRRFCREHLSHTLGLGAAVFVLQLIPLMGALFLTTAVVGAVVLHRRLQAPRSAAPAE
jgi:uncharacterized protein involved in cysteine biosynthesis